MNPITTLHALLDHYRLATPLPAEIRAYIIKKSRKKVLKKILRHMGYPGFLLGTSVTLLFFLKKIGISVSFLKAYVATLLITGMFVIPSAAYLGYVGSARIIAGVTSPREQQATLPQNIEQVIPAAKKTETHNDLVSRKKIPSSPLISIPENSIAIKNFDTGGLKTIHGKTAARILRKELQKVSGTRNVFAAHVARRKYFKTLIAGAIRKDTEAATYTVSTRIINIENGSVAAIVHTTLDELSAAKMTQACAELAKRIHDELQ